MFFKKAVRDSRLVRWVTIAIALNTVALIGPIGDYLQSDKTAKLIIPATNVQPMHDGTTGELNSYFVENISVEKVAIWAKRPTFGALFGVLGINIVLLAWILRLAILEHRFIIGDVEIKDIRAPFRKPNQGNEL